MKALLIAYPKNLMTENGAISREWLLVDRACNGLLSRFLSAELFKKTHELGEDYWWVLKPTDKSWGEVFLWASNSAMDLKSLKELTKGFENLECDPSFWMNDLSPSDVASKLKLPLDKISIAEHF